jgi:hypothetical protein
VAVPACAQRCALNVLLSWLITLGLAAILIVVSPKDRTISPRSYVFAFGCGFAAVGYSVIVSLAQGYALVEVLTLRDYGLVGRVIVLGYGLLSALLIRLVIDLFFIRPRQ